jgi:hypothetical protein
MLPENSQHWDCKVFAFAFWSSDLVILGWQKNLKFQNWIFLCRVRMS